MITTPTLPPWQQRLDSILREWDGTPWMAGQACKGRGADCRYFLMGVLDELYGITEPLPPRLPQDTSANNRALAVASVRQISTRYPCRVATGETIEPGDVLIVSRPATHEETLEHGMIVGVGDPLPVWHCGSAGVCFTALTGSVVKIIFRPLNKERWAR